MSKDKRDDQPLKKKGRRARVRKDLLLPGQWTPRLLEHADTRLHIVRVLRKKVARLMEEAGGHESYQKEMLCQHAVFMHVRLESMETEALEGKPLDWGQLTQCVNALSGILTKLGLSKRMKSAKDLTTYLKERNGDDH